MKQFLTVLLLSLGISSLSLAASSKIAPDLQAIDPNSTVRVIVQYAQAPAVASGQNGSILNNIPILGNVLNDVPILNGVVNMVLDVLHAVVYTVPASGLQNLANDPNVIYISPDRPLAARLDYSAAAVNAGVAWKSNRNGSGVGVAVIDSGINSSPDLKILFRCPIISPPQAASRQANS